MIQRSFKVSKRSLKGVSRQFQRCFKENSRAFHKKFQGCSKNLSMKFCFAILCMNLITATQAEGGLVFIFVVVVDPETWSDSGH